MEVRWGVVREGCFGFELWFEAGGKCAADLLGASVDSGRKMEEVLLENGTP